MMTMAEKKGSVEISLGQIIVIILAIVLLIGVYYVLTRILYGTGGATCDGTSEMLSEIFKTMGKESSRVCNVG